METITIKNSIIKNLVGVLAFLYFFFLSLLFFYFPDQPIINYLGGFGLFIFGSLALLSLGLALDRKPRLIINSEGIYDRTLKTGIIDWYDIENVYLQKIGNSRFICFILKDEEKYLLENHHQQSEKNSIIKDQFGMETINISIDGLEIDDKELIKTLKKEIARHEAPPKQVSLFDYDGESF